MDDQHTLEERTLSRPGGDDRFLSRGMAAGLAAYAAFALTFSYFQVKGDALVYFNVLRKFFGADPDFAFAYQFGSAVWNAPFYLVGKALGGVFGYQPRTFHVSFEEISITVATNAAFLLTLYFGWRILRDLQLPRGPAVLLLTVFGSPLFYYVVFDPAGKHATDTLALTAATLALQRVLVGETLLPAVALGVTAGWAVNIRAVNLAFLGVFLLGLLLARRFRAAATAFAVGCVVAAVIFALPSLRGIDYYVPEQVPFDVPFEPATAAERTGWTSFNGGGVTLLERAAPDGRDAVRVTAAVDGDGTYADLDGLTPHAPYVATVVVRGEPDQRVVATVEAPVGNLQQYLGSASTRLDGTWQRLTGRFDADGNGRARITVASGSGPQTFYVTDREVRRAQAAASTAAFPRVVRAGLVGAVDASTPAKMLAGEHRGLFLWTPLTGLAAIGYLIAVSSARRRSRARSFLVLLLVASASLVLAHTGWRQWDGGFAFSQRFLTGLFPLYLIGFAELVRRARWVAYTLGAAAAAFSLAIAFVHDIGYDGIGQEDGLKEHVDALRGNPRQFRLDVQDDAKARWEYLWGLLNGRDPECVNGCPPDDG